MAGKASGSAEDRTAEIMTGWGYAGRKLSGKMRRTNNKSEKGGSVQMKKGIAILLTLLMLLPMFGAQHAALAEKSPAAQTDSVISRTEADAPKTLKVTGVSSNSKKAVDCSLVVGQTLRLKTDASRKVTWTSSDKSVVTVTKGGKAVGKKAGSAVLTGTDGKKKYAVNVQVNWVLKASSKSTSMMAGVTRTIRMTFKEKGYLTWHIADPTVVDAQWDDYWQNNGTTLKLYLTGLKKGSTTVTVTNSATSDSVKIKVTVKAAKTKAKYRALVVGEETFVKVKNNQYWEDTCTRNTGDMNNIAAMLKKVKGAGGAKYTSVVKKKNLSYDGIRNAIISTFKSAKETDVSLFFIASHGHSSGDGELTMPFRGNIHNKSDVMDYLKSSKGSLPIKTLAAWLNSYVKGKVIVILESCGSGSAIFFRKDWENDASELVLCENPKELLGQDRGNEADTSAAFVSKAVQAFASRDPGLVESNSTGDMRSPKFYVLAASRHQELSWGTESGRYNYFTKWLIDGVGSASRSPADTDKNKQITLNELFYYISKVGDNEPFYDSDDKGPYYQHVQRYPASSNYVLFRWK